jgi:hypothetical protein
LLNLIYLIVGPALTPTYSDNLYPNPSLTLDKQNTSPLELLILSLANSLKTLALSELKSSSKKKTVSFYSPKILLAAS